MFLIKKDHHMLSIVFLFLTCVQLGNAESITGVILSNHSGQGGHASGEVQMATNHGIRTLYYGEPLRRRFMAKLCNDIGAIWSVEIRALADSSWVIENASCSGKVDPDAHSAWSLVREYLENLRNGKQPLQLFAPEWRNSSEGVEYFKRSARLDVVNYGQLGRNGSCIDVIAVEQSHKARLRAGVDCYLSIEDKPAALFFSSARDITTGRWQIDRIEVR